ncbi:MAG: LysE family transporter [Bacteroidetes bacterium]|nr:LysE family transporter [Bacteroidota bacterium]
MCGDDVGIVRRRAQNRSSYQTALDNIIFRVLGFFLLLYLGLKDITTKVEAFKYENYVQKNGTFHSAFLVGVATYVSNPALVAFWITLAGIVQSSGSIVNNIEEGVLFALGVGIGTAVWYYSLLKVLFWKRERFKAETLAILSRISGYIMLGFSAYIGYELLRYVVKGGLV